jgi:anthranilate phosphoribosyltransferase
VELPRPDWYETTIAELLNQRDIPEPMQTSVFRDILSGKVDDVLVGSLLTALRIKGESASEIVTAAACLRESMHRLVPVRGPTLDTCGTGGDDLGTFNISTAAAFVAAGAGVPVVKHGNRAVSSRSGSADVLRELGVPIEAGLEWAQSCLNLFNFAFCYAPHFHSGMANVSKVRRKLGIRTIFNLLGPLVNPASAEFQLIGIGHAGYLDTLAAAAAAMNTRRTILVCGFDGLDEVTLATPTMVRIVENGQYYNDEWDASDFGLETVRNADIQANTPAESAAIINSVLNSEGGPAERIVLANAAAGLFAADRVKNLRAGVELAEESIRSGAARRVLEQLRGE